MRAAIVLAAGRSRRFGAVDKRLARIGGRTLIERAVALAKAAPAARVLLVTDPHFRGRPPGVTLVRARRARLGMGESVAAGLAALRPRERCIFVFLADMPAIPAHMAWRLARALDAAASAARPVHGGYPGHPVLLRRSDVRPFGDRGLGPMLGADVRHVRAGRGVILDVDRPGDLLALRRGNRGGRLAR